MITALVSWEADYANGTTVRERDGVRYQDLDRDNLTKFRLVAPGEILAELRFHKTGHGLAYRRRTIMQSGNTEVWFVIGAMPSGPVIAYQPERDQVLRQDHFLSGSGPLGQMVPLPFERWTNTAHTTDAILRASRITLPSGYVLTV